MYRVYKEEFFQDKDLKNDYESSYTKAIIERARRTKAKIDVNGEVLTLYEITNSRINELYSKHNKKISCLPQNFEELLRISPKAMATIYVAFRDNQNNINEDFHNLFDKVLRHGKKNDNGEQYYEHVLLEYECYDDFIAEHIINTDYNSFLNLNTCFYCNSSYINVYTGTKNSFLMDPSLESLPPEEIEKRAKKQFDLDHFFPKGIKEATCPFFSLSLYNFVPSCHVCNSGAKLSNEFYKNFSVDQLEKIIPTSQSYHFDESVKFHIIPKGPIFITQESKNHFSYFADMQSNFKIDYEEMNIDAKLYLEEQHSFSIKSRYEQHMKEFLYYIDKKRKYPASYFLLLAQNGKLQDIPNIEEAIFNHQFRDEYQPIFSKIYKDIDNF